MSNIIPLFRSLTVRPVAVPPPPLSEEDIDWKELAKACAEVWPELDWSAPFKSVHGRQGRNVYNDSAHLWALRDTLRLTVIIPTPKVLSTPGWEVDATLEIPIGDAPAALRKVLLEGRRWWLKGRT